ncbi:M28 family metallopeptidase [Sphingobium aquiterrae]|uniref:M28 family metallopeptidase n=1 Tax=Sphingobium aquiterrae TaxID=2038656 RepID=UPI003AFB2919
MAATSPSAAGKDEAARGATWWAHVATLADDRLEGRLTGSPGYLKAADYVIAQLKALGLQPAGVDGYLQPVGFVEQRIDAAASKAALTTAEGATALSAPADIIFSGGGGPAPASIDAPMVFVGYGLHIPEAGHDDFAGVDLKGKIAVFISGGPANIAGALKSHARSERGKVLASMGAVGAIALTTAKQIEIPWSRRMLLASQPAMYLADASLRDTATPLMNAMFDTAKSEMLFTGSGHSFAELSALADASAPVPGFALTPRFSATIAAARKDLTSPNIVAVMPGTDPKLKAEYVVLSAHLDGLGVGEPIHGDTIYNGALDNASGVASLIEIAKALKAGKVKPKRSILFAIVCAEEKGLLGSRYFAERPTVPQGALVADLNFDMALPIFPLTSVTPLGYDQSSLGKDAAAVGETMGLPIKADPFPDRNTFIRSDQYSFIKAGIPALFFKYGFVADTPEAATEKAWRANVYHSPSDDAQQPVMPEQAVKLNDYVTALTLRVANAPARPSWNADSFFKRFEKK